LIVMVVDISKVRSCSGVLQSAPEHPEHQMSQSRTPPLESTPRVLPEQRAQLQSTLEKSLHLWSTLGALWRRSSCSGVLQRSTLCSGSALENTVVLWSSLEKALCSGALPEHSGSALERGGPLWALWFTLSLSGVLSSALGVLWECSQSAPEQNQILRAFSVRIQIFHFK
jgi:hypothetical protein